MKHVTNSNFRFWRGLWIAPLAVVFILSSGVVFAQDPATVENDSEESLSEFWTQERMDNAIPMDMEADPDASAAETDREEGLSSGGTPGYAPGFRPGETPTDPQAAIEMGSPEALASPPFSPPGFPTDYVNYAPFQRWSWFGKYTTYPTSTVGKLFFRTGGGGTGECSAAVIGRSTIATAGHCISNGNGTFYDMFLFCPSYNRQGGGVNPIRGCWGWRSATTTSQWHNNRAFDRDYACIVTSLSNSTTGQQVGNVTGALGRAWNWPSSQMTFVHGYPAVFPFPSSGNGIYTCASTEWYERNVTAGDGQVSKYLGCDMTPGSSGGPWWLNIRSPNSSHEVPAVDGSPITDPLHPGGPYLNGVTSHRISGYVSELGAAEFRNTGASGESEDIFASCFAVQ